MDIYFGFVLFLFACSFAVGYYAGYKKGDEEGYEEGIKVMFDTLYKIKGGEFVLKELIEEYER